MTGRPRAARAFSVPRGPLRALGAQVVAIALLLAVALPATASHESRTLVAASRLRDLPARGVVLVIVGRRAACTGFVIGSRKVATAGHCLVRDADGGDYRPISGVADLVTLYRAYSRVSPAPVTFPPCRVARTWIHPRFARSSGSDGRFGSRAHDYAVLTTSTSCSYPADAVLGLRPSTVAGGEMPVGTPISFLGYPADPRFDHMTGEYLWRSTGHVTSVPTTPERMFVTGFAGRGMSGAPILRTYGSRSPCGMRTCVTAILTECVVNDRDLCRLGLSPRGGVRITPEVRDTLLSH